MSTEVDKIEPAQTPGLVFDYRALRLLMGLSRW